MSLLRLTTTTTTYDAILAQNRQTLSPPTNSWTWYSFLCQWQGPMSTSNGWGPYDPGYIAIVPRNNPHVQALVPHLGKHVFPTKVCGTVLTWTNQSSSAAYRYFDSVSELESYVTSKSYGSGYSMENPSNRPVGIALIFEPSVDGKKWTYNMRLNSTAYFPMSNWNPVNKYTRYPWGLDSTGYSRWENIVSIQYWVDSAIRSYLSETMKPVNPPRNTTASLFTMKVPSLKMDDYYNGMQYFFPFFMLLAFLYPFMQIVGNLVAEKSKKIKEGMKMMGVTTSQFWLSWYIWYSVQFFLLTWVLVLIAKAGNIFPASNALLLFLWLYVFELCVLGLATMWSTLFDNPKAASMLSFVILVVTLFSGYAGQRFQSESPKLALCVAGPACFLQTLNNLRQFEIGQIGLQFSNLNEQWDYLSFGHAFGVMIADIFLYILITLYLDQVFPTKFGQTRPWYFMFLPSFWCPGNGQRSNEDIQMKLLDDRRISFFDTEYYESVDHGQIPTIRIRNLQREFSSLFGNDVVRAVDGIDLDMYEGEVFCLLGHNGAGKTTTINMLTGFLDVSDGDAFVNERSVKSEMSEIRKSLGVCPQHDVLWDNLTVEEHLRLFGMLKGVLPSAIDVIVSRTLEEVGIPEKRWNFPTQLSGGQRRKLSLGIALIGGSKIVFLDEPTSGMDPHSRRSTWEIIEKAKKERVIVLTTHFMDEADVLGDRIAIMSHGKVRCCGSSMFLKRLYGVGYSFTISLRPNVQPHFVQDQIDGLIRHVRGAEMVSIAGREIAYKLPFEKSRMFPEMLAQLEDRKNELGIQSYGISVTTLEEVFMKVGSDTDQTLKERQSMHSDNRISSLSAVQQRAAEEIRRSVEGKNEVTGQSVLLGSDDGTYVTVPAPTGDSVNGEKKVSGNERNEMSGCFMFFVHFIAMLYKRFHWMRRDVRTFICQVAIPVGLASIGLAIVHLLSLPLNSPVVTMTPAGLNFPAGHSIVYPTFQNNRNIFMTDPSWKSTYVSQLQSEYGSLSPRPGSSSDRSSLGFAQQLFDDSRRGNVHYTAMFFDPSKTSQVSLGTNLSFTFGVPIMTNLYSNWVIQHEFGNASVTMKYQNLPPTVVDKIGNQQLNGILSSLFLGLAFSFLPVGIVYNVVLERVHQTKHQQLVSGVSFNAYWIANFFMDFLIGMPAAFAAWGLVHAFDVKIFLGEAQFVFVVILVLYVWSVTPFTYVFSRAFQSPQRAQYVTVFAYLALGLVLTMISFMMQGLAKTVYDLFDYCFFMAFPSYLMCTATIRMAMRKDGQSPWDWDVTSKYIVWMAWEGVLYFLVMFALEYVGTYPEVMNTVGRNIDIYDGSEMAPLDEDVQDEKDKILASVDMMGNVLHDSDDAVVLCGLRKVYRGNPPKVAVKSLHFSIPRGEVFGFLGVNGAGKTTTLSMLTGRIFPSRGTAFVNGIPINDQISARRYIGYCPQFDALFDLLTAREHLRFYGRIKGLSSQEVEESSARLMMALGLERYADRCAGTYSGGNKRKLSVAISMIGGPPVVFLDEPSTGMDPMARRHMWDFISATMADRCVILTTHSMEECEALCNRLGIMVDGQLQCLGTPQHLKTRFGRGYTLMMDVKTEETEYNATTALTFGLAGVVEDSSSDTPLATAVFGSQPKIKQDVALDTSGGNGEMDDDGVNMHGLIDSILNQLNLNFPCTLVEQNRRRLVFEIERSDTSLAQMFSVLEKLKTEFPIESYALSQTTLEQIFLRMAGDEDDGEN